MFAESIGSLQNDSAGSAQNRNAACACTVGVESTYTEKCSHSPEKHRDQTKMLARVDKELGRKQKAPFRERLLPGVLGQHQTHSNASTKQVFVLALCFVARAWPSRERRSGVIFSDVRSVPGAAPTLGDTMQQELAS